MRPTLIVIFDSVKDEMTVVTPVRPAPGVSAKAAYARAADRLNLVLERLEQPLPHAGEPDVNATASGASRPPPSRRPIMAKVERAKDYIAAGDIFQVVLEPALRGAVHAAPPSRFIARCGGSILRPSSIISNFGGFAVVGSSPEILVRVRDGEVTIRPIAGTRPRGASPEQDKALAA